MAKLMAKTPKELKLMCKKRKLEYKREDNTYIPKEELVNRILEYDEAWKANPDRFHKYAIYIAGGAILLTLAIVIIVVVVDIEGREEEKKDEPKEKIDNFGLLRRRFLIEGEETGMVSSANPVFDSHQSMGWHFLFALLCFALR